VPACILRYRYGAAKVTDNIFDMCSADGDTIPTRRSALYTTGLLTPQVHGGREMHALPQREWSAIGSAMSIYSKGLLRFQSFRSGLSKLFNFVDLEAATHTIQSFRADIRERLPTLTIHRILTSPRWSSGTTKDITYSSPAREVSIGLYPNPK